MGLNDTWNLICVLLHALWMNYTGKQDFIFCLLWYLDRNSLSYIFPVIFTGTFSYHAFKVMKDIHVLIDVLDAKISFLSTLLLDIDFEISKFAFAKESKDRVCKIYYLQWFDVRRSLFWTLHLPQVCSNELAEGFLTFFYFYARARGSKHQGEYILVVVVVVVVMLFFMCHLLKSKKHVS